MEQQQWQPPHPHIISNPHSLPPPTTTMTLQSVTPTAVQLVPYHPPPPAPPYYHPQYYYHPIIIHHPPAYHHPNPEAVYYHYANNHSLVYLNHQPQPVVFQDYTYHQPGFYAHPQPPPTHHFPAEEVLPEVGTPEKEKKEPVLKPPGRSRYCKTLPPRQRALPINTRPKAVWRIKTPPPPAPVGDTPPPSPANTELTPEHTTVMIKNIPNCVRRNFMLKILDRHCKRESVEYDFMYLPMDFGSGNNLGYAFVNFTTADSANKFKNSFHGFEWKNVAREHGWMTSNKVCEITWAVVQGRDNLMERFQATVFDCDKRDYLPVLLDPPRGGLNQNQSPPIVIGELLKRS